MGMLAVILSGGQALKMGLLTQRRAKPMLRFGGKYRLIDFCLSIIANSGLEATAVLAQHHTAVLKAYLQEAKTWRLAMLEVWEPGNNSKYLGTADAVWQNHQRILSTGCEQVLVLSGDQVFRQNFAALAAFHQQKGGAVTIAALPVALEQAHRFGMLTVNADSKILTFNEKPQQLEALPPHSLASLGIYVFNTQTLLNVLEENAQCADSGHDFGRNILPRLTADGKAYACPFEGYWTDINTVPEYWEANMALLEAKPALALDDPAWVFHTIATQLPPTRLRGAGRITDSLVAEGCVIEGEVSHSVLSPGVWVEAGAVVRDSVVLDGAMIRKGAVVERCVVDEDVEVGPLARPSAEEEVAGIGVIGRK